MTMKYFWGIEVKPGQTVKCKPGIYFQFHISQAVLVESEAESEVGKRTLYVKAAGTEQIAIGVLSADKFPQVHLDLSFDKDFELSHTCKTASVFLSGYKFSHT